MLCPTHVFFSHAATLGKHLIRWLYTYGFLSASCLFVLVCLLGWSVDFVGCLSGLSARGSAYLLVVLAGSVGPTRHHPYKAGSTCHKLQALSCCCTVRVNKLVVCQSNIAAFFREAVPIIPGYERSSPVAPTCFDRLISGYRLALDTA